MGLHKNITEGDLHVPGFIDSSDPGAVGAGRLWIDTSGGTGNWVTKIRNDADDGWEEVSGSGGGGGATDYDDLTSYKDLVTLQKSGAGYPSGSNETALYDGDGNQIIPRTAVRHWLDPHPDAASFDETWEFSTTGDMTQGQLETAGWTFTDCTAEVSGGQLLITTPASGSVYPKASLDVSFSGDFDVVVTPGTLCNYVAGANYALAAGLFIALGVADYRAGTADLAHYVTLYKYNGATLTDKFYIGGAWTTHGSTSDDSDNVYASSGICRLFRESGTLKGCSAGFSSGIGGALVVDNFAGLQMSGFTNKTGTSDSSTFNKLFIPFDYNDSPCTSAVYPIASLRRFQ